MCNQDVGNETGPSNMQQFITNNSFAFHIKWVSGPRQGIIYPSNLNKQGAVLITYKLEKQALGT